MPARIRLAFRFLRTSCFNYGVNAIVPRFVILHHETPAKSLRATHWDFMLEWGDVLRTWALAAEPCDAIPLSAEALADHRTAYLQYEGPVSGDRGHVTQWDAGQFELTSASDDELRCELRGGRLVGTAMLSRSEKSHGGDQRWTFLFRNK